LKINKKGDFHEKIMSDFSNIIPYAIPFYVLGMLLDISHCKTAHKNL
jgi:hypothetical protein